MWILLVSLIKKTPQKTFLQILPFSESSRRKISCWTLVIRFIRICSLWISNLSNHSINLDGKILEEKVFEEKKTAIFFTTTILSKQKIEKISIYTTQIPWYYTKPACTINKIQLCAIKIMLIFKIENTIHFDLCFYYIYIIIILRKSEIKNRKNKIQLILFWSCELVCAYNLYTSLLDNVPN